MVGRARGVVTMVALSAATASCLGHLPPCPAAGGPAWSELESPHFRLRTDEDPAAARAALIDLEQFQAALLSIFGAPPDFDTGRLPVVVVDRGWTDFAARKADGYFTHALFQPLIVMMSGGQLFSQTVIKHELIHHLSRLIMRRQPHWLSEGLATFYETIEYDASTGRITVGRPSLDRLRGARNVGVTTIERMFATDKIDPDDTGRFYAAAWITTHYLMNHRMEALRGYERALRSGATPEAAWTAAFGAETPAQLAADVRRYLDGGQYALLIYRLPAPILQAPVARPLTDADAHAMRALLYLTGHGTRALEPELALAPDDASVAARREVGEALRQQPDHVMAGAIAHFMLSAPVDPAGAAAATRKNADDWLAWLLVAEVSRQRGDDEGWNQALARALETSRADRSIQLPIVTIRAR